MKSFIWRQHLTFAKKTSLAQPKMRMKFVRNMAHLPQKMGFDEAFKSLKSNFSGTSASPLTSEHKKTEKINVDIRENLIK